MTRGLWGWGVDRDVGLVGPGSRAPELARIPAVRSLAGEEKETEEEERVDGVRWVDGGRPPGKGRREWVGVMGALVLLACALAAGEGSRRNSEVTPMEAGSFGAEGGMDAPRDSVPSAGKRPKSAVRGLGADSGKATGDSAGAAPGVGAVEPEGEAEVPEDSLGKSGKEKAEHGPEKDASVAAQAEAGAPDLILLPLAIPAGTHREGGDSEKVETALRLGLTQAGLFRVGTAEEAGRAFRGRAPRDCFSERCVEKAGRRLPTGLMLASQYSTRDSTWLLKLVLVEVPQGRIREAVQVWGRAGKGGLIRFAREAALRLALPGKAREDRDTLPVDGTLFAATRPWRDIPWLNPRDTVDNRPRWGWTGSGLLLAGTILAWSQGHLLQEDGNGSSPSRGMLSGAGTQSFLRGFFAAPTLGARYSALGGAGIAHVDNGLSLLMNPAGIAGAGRDNVVAAKRSLPDGTPSFFLAYAGPLYRGWAQGLGMQFEGDRLANETTLHGAFARDLGFLGKAWAGIKAGAQAKAYLAQVGESGTGEDRSTGRSFGMGLDLGLQARLSDRITAALAIRDAAGFLRHTNTYTDRSYAEILPTEYRLGAAYRASPDLLLLMDGQKAMYADQVDHVRLGGERILFDFLALRCGLHEIFGREAVRKISLGFGLDTEGLSDRTLGMKVGLNYAYEFGLKEDEPLGAGQQFSLEASF